MIKPVSLEQVYTALNQLNSRLEKLEKQDVDLHGRRIINAANAVKSSDYVTLEDLTSKIAETDSSFNTTVEDTDSVVGGNLVAHRLSHTFTKIGVNMTPDAAVDVKDGTIRASDGTNTPILAGKGAEVTCTGGIAYFIAYDRTGAAYIPLNLHGSTVTITGNLAFFGGTPVAQLTLAGYASNSQNSAYVSTPAALAQAATLVDLNALRVAYETLRSSYDDLRTKLRATTLVL